MSELEANESKILAALATITNHWDAMLIPASSGGGSGSKSAQITADDHAETSHDVDWATRVVSLRRFTVDVLNGWSRVVMEDRPITKALPDGRDAKAMCAFLERHARWMVGHEAVEDYIDEIGSLARQITSMVSPARKEWISLGACPLRLEETVCGGQVRAWPRAEDRDGEVMARCLTCGTEAVATWWESQMFDDAELKMWLTDADLVAFVHRVFGRVIKEATIRQWVRRAILVPSDQRDDRGRRLFHREAVIYALDRHEKREHLNTP